MQAGPLIDLGDEDTLLQPGLIAGFPCFRVCLGLTIQLDLLFNTGSAPTHDEPAYAFGLIQRDGSCHETAVIDCCDRILIG